jgi:hypothetical protein
MFRLNTPPSTRSVAPWIAAALAFIASCDDAAGAQDQGSDASRPLVCTSAPLQPGLACVGTAVCESTSCGPYGWTGKLECKGGLVEGSVKFCDPITRLDSGIAPTEAGVDGGALFCSSSPPLPGSPCAGASACESTSCGPFGWTGKLECKEGSVEGAVHFCEPSGHLDAGF